jgi:hypothetical protein
MARIGDDSEFGTRLQPLVIDIRERILPDRVLFIFTMISFSVQGFASPSLFIPRTSSLKQSHS